MRYDLINNMGEVIDTLDLIEAEVVSVATERGAVNAWPYVWAQAVYSSAYRNAWQACRRRKGEPPGCNEYRGPVFLGRDECKQWIADQVWEF